MRSQLQRERVRRHSDQITAVEKAVDSSQEVFNSTVLTASLINDQGRIMTINSVIAIYAGSFATVEFERKWALS